MTAGIDIAELSTTVRPQDDLYRYANGPWLEQHRDPRGQGDLRRLPRALGHGRGRTSARSSRRPRPPSTRRAARLARSVTSSPASWTRRRSSGSAPDRSRTSSPWSPRSRTRPALVKALGDARAPGRPGRLPLLGGHRREEVRRVHRLSDAGRHQPARRVLLPRGQLRSRPRRRTWRTSPGCSNWPSWPTPDGAAERIMALETRLAGSHWDRVKNRDVTADLQQGRPGRARRADPRARLVRLARRAPAYRRVRSSRSSSASRTTSRRPPGRCGGRARPTGRTGSAGAIVHTAAPLLSNAFVDENFAFYGKTLTGAPELRERWKRGLGVVESALGEAVGQLYVAEHFPPVAKARMVELVANLVEAYRQRIDALDWMGPETRQRALEKLAGSRRRSATRTSGRTTARSRSDRGRPGRQRPPVDRGGDRARPGQARPAGRPGRVADDAADGQRVLQPADERDRLPGRRSCSRRSSTWTRTTR